MDSLKTCFKCKLEKERSEFYAHPQMGDGLLGKCKECAKSDVRAHRSLNIEKIRAYDRARAKHPDRAKAAAEISKRWRQSDKRITSAHNKVTRALRKGEIFRLPCERCGRTDSYGHHENYDRPLDVTWLCQPCHKERHKEMSRDGIVP